MLFDLEFLPSLINVYLTLKLINIIYYFITLCYVNKNFMSAKLTVKESCIFCTEYLSEICQWKFCHGKCTIQQLKCVKQNPHNSY